MYLPYILRVLAFLFGGGPTLHIDSQLSNFAKLCFLPQNPVNLELLTLPTQSGSSERYYGIIGNEVMGQRLYQFLTEKKESGSSEDLEKLCVNTNDDGKSIGTFSGLGNLTVSYICKHIKAYPGIHKCHYESASQKEDSLMYFTIVDENVVFEIDCFKNGQVGWSLFSKNPKLPEEDIQYYYAHAASLGFHPDTNRVIFGDACEI